MAAGIVGVVDMRRREAAVAVRSEAVLVDDDLEFTLNWHVIWGLN